MSLVVAGWFSRDESGGDDVGGVVTNVVVAEPWSYTESYSVTCKVLFVSMFPMSSGVKLMEKGACVLDVM